MDWKKVIGGLAPTVATALGGPLAGAAVGALGQALGLGEDASQIAVADVISQGKMTAEQVTEIKKLELQFQNEEKERGFKYAELAYKDRDSARQNNTAGGVQKHIFWLSILLLAATLGSEITVLFKGYPDESIPDIIVGRVLGLFDAVAMMVLTYWYGTTSNSNQKTELLAQAQPIK